jgi:hypothetical protein
VRLASAVEPKASWIMACGVEVEERFSHGLLVKVHNSGQPKTGEMTSKMVIKLNEKWPFKKKGSSWNH